MIERTCTGCGASTACAEGLESCPLCGVHFASGQRAYFSNEGRTRTSRLSGSLSAFLKKKPVAPAAVVQTEATTKSTLSPAPIRSPARAPIETRDAPAVVRPPLSPGSGEKKVRLRGRLRELVVKEEEPSTPGDLAEKKCSFSPSLRSFLKKPVEDVTPREMVSEPPTISKPEVVNKHIFGDDRDSVSRPSITFPRPTAGKKDIHDTEPSHPDRPPRLISPSISPPLDPGAV